MGSVISVITIINKIVKGLSDAANQGSSKMLNMTIHNTGNAILICFDALKNIKKRALKKNTNPIKPVLSQIIRNVLCTPP